jgi:RNA-directed DNA polymerase
MMHESEKSDSAVVATKSANKAGQPVAELMERRAGTGRNANQQSTCRAQNRESVSQALVRVRQANDTRLPAKYSR